MTTGIKFRLGSFAAAIALLAFLMAGGAYTSHQEVKRLHEQYHTNQLETFEIADHLQDSMLELNNALTLFEERHDQGDLDRFYTESDALNRWFGKQKLVLKDSASEIALLNRIYADYQTYLANASNTVLAFKGSPVGTVSLPSLIQITTNCQAILRLGYKLESAHRDLLKGSWADSEMAVARLEWVIIGALILLLVLAIWLGVTVYRELISPLRVQLIETQALAERQEKLASLGMLAAGVAHEIRNPLTAIKARLFTQHKKLKAGTPEHEDAQVISQEINRLERIVRDFLLFARPSDPKLTILPAGQPLREVQALLAPQLQNNNIQLAVVETCEASIKADLQQIKQVLINLVQNAADSIGHNGSIKLRARLDTVRLADRPTDAVVLEVADTGKGITPEVQKRLFDPFFSTKEGGTGLGLPIAARIIENHGGALQYQTRINHGTTFGIVLPRVESAHKPPA